MEPEDEEDDYFECQECGGTEIETHWRCANGHVWVCAACGEEQIDYDDADEEEEEGEDD